MINKTVGYIKTGHLFSVSYELPYKCYTEIQHNQIVPTSLLINEIFRLDIHKLGGTTLTNSLWFAPNFDSDANIGDKSYWVKFEFIFHKKVYSC